MGQGYPISDTKSYECKTPLTARIFLVLTTGFTEQNFLGQPWIPLLFKAAPKKYRRSLALRLLAMSPHYFIYQWSTRYPSTMSRIDILEAEHQRNAFSRKELCEQILRPHLQPQMTVLDFGCGPGYLAREVAKYAKKVLAVDISCGAIACAKELNSLGNISYYTNNGKDLSMLDTSSVDLVYSFAVVQHLSEELFEGFLKEFFRVLKPQGKVICHIALGDNAVNVIESEHKNNSLILRHLKGKFSLRFVFRAAEDINQKVISTGFKEPAIIPTKQISDVDDDIVEQHLVIFSKP